MGRASSRKVTRAAMTGGGRLAGQRRSYGFYSGIALIAVVGLVLVFVSRGERRRELAVGTVPPVANKDHWHAAYGFYLCDGFGGTLPETTRATGLHTHADGLIHIEPNSRLEGGNNATLGRFASRNGVRIGDTTLRALGKTYTEGDDKCGGKPGEIVVKIGDRVVTTDVASVKLEDNALVTVGFVAKGTGSELPPPPSASELSNQQAPPSAPPGAATETPPGQDQRDPAPATGGEAPAPADSSPSTSTP